MSKSSGWLMVTIIPIFISDLIKSLALIPIRLANSPTVIVSEIRMIRLIALGTVISVFFTSGARSFPPFFLPL